MEVRAELYSMSYRDVKSYLFAILFIAGNIILPQICHIVPNGGLMILPIYFFTLIAAYKYGIWVGLLTAVFSPLVNNLLFGMPVPAVLPFILIKSVLLAVTAAYAAYYFGRVSIFILLGVVLTYQIVGTTIEWIVLADFFKAVQDFRIGMPGMFIQVAGGYAVLKVMTKL